MSKIGDTMIKQIKAYEDNKGRMHRTKERAEEYNFCDAVEEALDLAFTSGRIAYGYSPYEISKKIRKNRHKLMKILKSS